MNLDYLYQKVTQISNYINEIRANSKRIDELPNTTEGTKTLAAWNNSSGKTEKITRDDLVNQNNRPIERDLGLLPGNGILTPAEIRDYFISVGLSFNISEITSIVFIKAQKKNGLKTYNYLFYLLLGKGVWGFQPGQTPFVASVIRSLYERELIPTDINPGPNVQITNLGQIDSLDDFIDTANENSYDFSDPNISYYMSYSVIEFPGTDAEKEVLYLSQFIGTPGQYGGTEPGSTLFTEDDFINTANSNIQPIDDSNYAKLIGDNNFTGTNDFDGEVTVGSLTSMSNVNVDGQVYADNATSNDALTPLGQILGLLTGYLKLSGELYQDVQGEVNIQKLTVTQSPSDPNDVTTKTYVDGLVANAIRDIGNWDASLNTFPTVGSGSGGAIRRGDLYRVSVAGNPFGTAETLDIGDSFRALVANPGQNPANWGKMETNTAQATSLFRGTSFLYDTLGENTNGSITQEVITSEFNSRVNIFIKSNESLTGASRKGDILYGILDQYTGEDMSLFKIFSIPPIVDNIIYFELNGEYFMRVISGATNPKWFGAKGDGVTDDLIPIQKSLSSLESGTIHFPKGIYNISSFTNLGSNIKITGVRGSSVIKLTTPNVQIFQVLGESNITIENITLQGYYPDVTLSGGIPMPADGIVDSSQQAIDKTNISTGTGIGIQGGEKINILNCEFRNFGAYGLIVAQSGKTFEYGIKVHNCYFHDNYIGMELKEEAEYSSFVGNSFTRNQIGTYMTSGNNLFTGNHFDKNRVGVVLTNGLNDAHGTFATSTFNHNALYGVIANNITNGEAFEGCQFWYGNIYLKNSKGINIEGGIIGASSVLVEGHNDGQNKIQGVCFHASDINENWNGVSSNIITKDNFNKDGSDATLLNNWNKKDNDDQVFNAVFKLQGKTVPDKQILINLNTVGNFAEIQAIWAGVTNLPLYLNRQGGNILIGNVADTGEKVQIGGKLKITDVPTDPTHAVRKLELDALAAIVSNAVLQSGNTLGANMRIGTKDDYNVGILVNNILSVVFSSGQMNVGGNGGYNIVNATTKIGIGINFLTYSATPSSGSTAAAHTFTKVSSSNTTVDIASFMGGTSGSTLLAGVRNDGSIYGQNPNVDLDMVNLGTLKAYTGWAQYTDTIYTSGSPFTVTSGSTSTLPNNAGTVLNTQLPTGVTSWYNPATNKITPSLDGDYYITTIRFKAMTTAPTAGYFDFGVDIGGALGVQFKETKIFAKGAGIEHNFSVIVPMFAAATFIANGGLVKITAGNGNMTIYDISFQIDRTHKSK